MRACGTRRRSTNYTSALGQPLSVFVSANDAPASADAWVEERVDVLHDWLALFKESEAPRPGGIAVLTDADDTRSTAAGDYANFRACKGS